MLPSPLPPAPPACRYASASRRALGGAVSEFDGADAYGIAFGPANNGLNANEAEYEVAIPTIWLGSGWWGETYTCVATPQQQPPSHSATEQATEPLSLLHPPCDPAGPLSHHPSSPDRTARHTVLLLVVMRIMTGTRRSSTTRSITRRERASRAAIAAVTPSRTTSSSARASPSAARCSSR